MTNGNCVGVLQSAWVGAGLLGLALGGCSPSDQRPIEVVSREQQAVNETWTIENLSWTHMNMGKTGAGACNPAQGDWDYVGGVISAIDGSARGLTRDNGDLGPCESEETDPGSYDSASFFYAELPGNFELVVRVASITGVDESQVGLMMRENVGELGTGRRGAVTIQHRARGTHCSLGSLDVFGQIQTATRTFVDWPAGAQSNDLAELNYWEDGGYRTHVPNPDPDPEHVFQPVWLRLQRFGSDYSASRALDEEGHDRPTKWVPLGGGEFTDGPAYVGLFIASGPEHVPPENNRTTATFDRLFLRAADPSTEDPVEPSFRSGAIGSSRIAGGVNFPLTSKSSGYVSAGMHGFYVAPDGTSYKYAQATDPGGYEVQAFAPDGGLVRLPYRINHGFLEGGIGGGCENPADSTTCSVYYAKQVPETPASDGNPYIPPEARLHQWTRDLDGEATVPYTHGDQPVRIRGLSASGSHLFVSDYGRPSVCPEPEPDPDPNERSCVINSATCDTTSCARQEETQCVLDPGCSQSRFIRIVDIAAWENEPLVEQKCPLERPGPSAVDNDGHVWVIQPATAYPTQDKNDLGAYELVQTPSIVCRTPDCTACGSITSGLVNPTGVAVDPNTNRLFVTENGPSQKILVFEGLASSSPTLATTFGQDGGVFSGPNPGLLVDPNDGGDHRFNALLGVGLDNSGNLYVASSAPRTEIRKFPSTPAGTSPWGPAAWGVYGLGREIGVVDPETGADFYTLNHHWTLDPATMNVDFDWKPKAIIRPPFDIDGHTGISAPKGHHSLGGLMRFSRFGPVVHGHRQRFIFDLSTPFQMRILRFQWETGETMIPCGSIAVSGENLVEVWMDSNEDGDKDPTEIDSVTHPGFVAKEVAEDGSIWLSGQGLKELQPQWSNNSLVPLYSLDAAWKVVPGEFEHVQATLFVPEREDVPDDEGGSLYVLGTVAPTRTNPVCELRCPPDGPVPDPPPDPMSDCATVGLCCNDSGPLSYKGWCSACGYRSMHCEWGSPVVVRFKNWHGTPIEDFRQPLEDPIDTATEPDRFVIRLADGACNSADWGYHSIAVARDKLFIQDRHGTILVHDALTGAELDRVFPGPETSGTQGWGDFEGGLQVTKVPNSDDYLIATVDTSDRARTQLYRWKPLDVGRGDGEPCFDSRQCLSGFCASGICCATSCQPNQCQEQFGCVNLEGQPGTCLGVESEDGTPCYDGDPLTSNDRCVGGECVGVVAVSAMPVAWYYASENDMTLQSGLVHTWWDRTTNDFDVSNTFEPGRPTYNATGWNGNKPTVTFSGGNLLRNTTWAGPGAGTDQAFSVFAVFRAATAHNGTLAAWWVNSPLAAVRCSVLASDVFDLARDDDNGFGQSLSPNASVGTDRHVVAWRFSPPDQLRITVDGTPYSSQAPAAIGAVSTTMFILGARSNLPTWLFQGDISELVVFDTFVSDEDVDNFHDYARLEWGGLD